MTGRPSSSRNIRAKPSYSTQWVSSGLNITLDQNHSLSFAPIRMQSREFNRLQRHHTINVGTVQWWWNASATIDHRSDSYSDQAIRAFISSGMYVRRTVSWKAQHQSSTIPHRVCINNVKLLNLFKPINTKKTEKRKTDRQVISFTVNRNVYQSYQFPQLPTTLCVIRVESPQ